MNISKIKQMASTGDLSVSALRYLLECHGECEHLDFKEIIELDSNYGCACIGKDALAMKNIGGGYIVVGVEDKTWKPVGLRSRLPYDTKKLRDKIRKGTGLDIESDIVHHSVFVGGTENLFAIILIRAATKRSKLKVPSICRKSYYPGEVWGIRQGDIYVRDGDQTKRLDNEQELLTLLDELEARYQEAELAQVNSIPSPFAVDSGFYRILPREYETFIGRENYIKRLKDAVEQDPRLWIINLHGPGGVGKSALATWLAYEYYHKKNFEAILHLSAKDQELSHEEGIRHLRPTLVSLEDFLDRVLHLFEHGEFCLTNLEKRKEVVTEILIAFRALLILDNMESVRDGRIMEFIRSLPPETKTKVLLTSRRRSSEWEYPIQVTEFTLEEIREFIDVRNKEMKLDLPTNDPIIIKKISEITGGLPLAIQWTLGEYSKSNNLDEILTRAVDHDSPLLEFSFRNSWNILDDLAKRALAVLTIFDSPPTLQLWRTALDWPLDKIERAISSLVEVTFVTERTEQKTGLVVYHALPITLTFARNELAKLGDLEHQARLRYHDYLNRIELTSVESKEYEDLFKRFNARSDNEKKAIIFCRMAEGQARSFGYEEAEQYYQQALEIDPRNVYVLVSYGLFKLELNNYGEALDLMGQAAKRCTKRTSFYVYFNMAKVYDQIRDRVNRVRCLREALKYEPNHVIARHSLGVSLGQMGNHEEAIQIFDSIICQELNKVNGPSDSLEVALKTKLISLKIMKKKEHAKIAIEEVLDELRRKGRSKEIINRIEGLRDEI